MCKKFLLIILSAIFMISCGSSKNVSSSYHKKKTGMKPSSSSVKIDPITETTTASPVKTDEVTVADRIIWTAVTYKGVPYKFGGMSDRGMDCSGLIHISFKQRNIEFPRTSRDMYAKGYEIPLRKVQRGDLLFFKTSQKRVSVNHVGLVTSTYNGDIRFIHATSSKGVIVTSLAQTYWKRAFISAKRVL